MQTDWYLLLCKKWLDVIVTDFPDCLVFPFWSEKGCFKGKIILLQKWMKERKRCSTFCFFLLFFFWLVALLKQRHHYEGNSGTKTFKSLEISGRWDIMRKFVSICILRNFMSTIQRFTVICKMSALKLGSISYLVAFFCFIEKKIPILWLRATNKPIQFAHLAYMKWFRLPVCLHTCLQQWVLTIPMFVVNAQWATVRYDNDVLLSQYTDAVPAI